MVWLSQHLRRELQISAYLKANPDSTEYIKGKIKNELARLDEKREWEDTLAYGKNEQNDLGKRTARLRRYIQKESSGLYVEDAKKLLKRLQEEEQGVKRSRRLADIQRKKELEQRKWNEINAVIRNREINVFDRIRSLESYISENSSGRSISSISSVISVGSHSHLTISKASTPASTMEPWLRSEASNLNLTWLLGVM